MITIVFVLSFCQAGCGPKDQPPAVKQLSNEELVERLASDNPVPVLRRNGPRYSKSFPEGYDSRHQEVIRSHVDELVTRAYQAFPSLIQHLDDKRYCCVGGSAEEPFTATVGDVCWLVLHCHIRPWPGTLYRPYLRAGEQSEVYIIPAYDSAAKWFEERKNKSLLELQREAIQRSLEFVENPNELQNDPKLRHDYSNGLEWCARYLDTIQRPIPIRVNWIVYTGSNEKVPDGEPVLRFITTPLVIVDKAALEIVGRPPFDVGE